MLSSTHEPLLFTAFHKQCSTTSEETHVTGASSFMGEKIGKKDAQEQSKSFKVHILFSIVTNTVMFGASEIV